MKINIRPDRIIPLLFIVGGVLLILSVVVWYVLASSTPPITSSNSALFSTNLPAPEIARVSLTDAKAAFDTKQATFVDVRDPGSYASSHIPGSINIPLAELENQLSELPHNKWIITYCT